MEDQILTRLWQLDASICKLQVKVLGCVYNTDYHKTTAWHEITQMTSGWLNINDRAITRRISPHVRRGLRGYTRQCMMEIKREMRLVDDLRRAP